MGSLTMKEQVKTYVFEGKNPENKRIILTAGMHGGETTSIIILRDLISYLKNIDEDSIKGTITAVPVCNPEAFRYKRRTNPADSKDLNRVFPGDEEGQPTERLASYIWGMAKDKDYVLDLHSCGKDMRVHPYLLTLFNEGPALKLIKNIPYETVVGSRGTRGQLFVEALKNGIPAAIWEVNRGGCNGAINLRDRRIIGKRLIQTLENLGFIEGLGKNMDQRFFGEWKRDRARKRGLFIPKTKAGSTVEEGEKIGRIDGESVHTEEKGRVIRISKPGIKFPGDSVYALAPSRDSI